MLCLLTVLATLACERSDQGPTEPASAPRSLPALVDVGPVPPSTWTVHAFRPGASSDTITLRQGASDVLIEDAIVQASARTAVICYQGGGPYRNLTLRNSILRVEPKTLAEDRSFWALRGYDMIDTTLERVEITGFGAKTRRHDEGHAIYLNVAGALTIERCDVHHNGGQGLQLVNRPGESSLPAGPAAGSITLVDTRFRENGFNPDRGGFQISIFGTGQSIRMEDVEILAGIDGTFEGAATGGALLIEAEAARSDRTVWWKTADSTSDAAPPFTQGKVELLRVRVHHRGPNRALVQIKGCDELVVVESEFSGGRVELDDPEKPGRTCGRIVWRGNRGDAEVFVRGERKGRADEDFVVGADDR